MGFACSNLSSSSLARSSMSLAKLEEERLEQAKPVDDEPAEVTLERKGTACPIEYYVTSYVISLCRARPGHRAPPRQLVGAGATRETKGQVARVLHLRVLLLHLCHIGCYTYVTLGVTLMSHWVLPPWPPRPPPLPPRPRSARSCDQAVPVKKPGEMELFSGTMAD
eukprot:1194987-Prorocentrum_minimum.AAC.2